MRLAWKVGLSNGETFIEGNEPFEIIPGETSPWLRLLSYIKKENLSITSLSLTDGKRNFNLPSAGKDPKFSAFANAEKPLGYNYWRPVGGDIKPGAKVDKFFMIEAYYMYFTVQLWVDAHSTSNTWVVVVPRVRKVKVKG
jgi:hypothetical protein